MSRTSGWYNKTLPHRMTGTCRICCDFRGYHPPILVRMFCVYACVDVAHKHEYTLIVYVNIYGMAGETDDGTICASCSSDETPRGQARTTGDGVVRWKGDVLRPNTVVRIIGKRMRANNNITKTTPDAGGGCSPDRVVSSDGPRAMSSPSIYVTIIYCIRPLHT